ncbi:carboxylating nicotinate-nucleotide diphosphorylase [Candidatus Bathyarchaeota archaeon]|nr:carboxylating nicotinate-nucleotide diphosphorylase [Candidatus Bathyarchaeota archaeon]
MPVALLREKLLCFLREDVGMGDLTTAAVAPTGIHARAQIVTKEPAVVAGVREAQILFKAMEITIVKSINDGADVPPGTIVMEIEGPADSILTSERTALNILTRMSGIATATRRLIEKIQKTGLRVSLAATRKTAPGLQYFDKRAIALGGGDPHRFHLDDCILIKDNHIVIAGGLEEAVKRALTNSSFTKKIEVEVRTPEEAVQAARLGVDIVMLDNMTPEVVKTTLEALAVHGLRDKILVEVSGGVTEENIMEYVRLGPDIVSLGDLTHSVQAVDMSLEITEVKTTG